MNDINYSQEEVYFPTPERLYPQRFKSVLELYVSIMLEFKRVGYSDKTLRLVCSRDEIRYPDTMVVVTEHYDMEALKASCFDYLLPKLPLFQNHLAMIKHSRSNGFDPMNHHFNSEQEFLADLYLIDKLKAS